MLVCPKQYHQFMQFCQKNTYSIVCTCAFKFCLFSSDTPQVLMFVCPSISQRIGLITQK